MSKETVIDKRILGEIVRQARKNSGYENAATLVQALDKHIGIKVSQRTLYDIENGKRLPSLEVYLGLQMLMPEVLNEHGIKPAFMQFYENTLLLSSDSETKISVLDRIIENVKTPEFKYSYEMAEARQELENMAPYFLNLYPEYRDLTKRVIESLTEIQLKDINS